MFSYYLSVRYHIDTVRRNSVLVNHGSFRVNRDCDTIPQLSNYLTRYFLHFSDDKFKTIHDILIEHIQFSYPEDISITFTCKTIFLPQPNIKSLHNIINTHYIIPENLACYMVHLYAISCTNRDNTRAVFFKTIATCTKILGSSII